MNACGIDMKNIYVGNLPFSSTSDEIQQLFEAHGAVSRVHLVEDRDTGRPRGFGFVEMEDESAGNAAIEALNESEFGGRNLVVNEARPREPAAVAVVAVAAVIVVAVKIVAVAAAAVAADAIVVAAAVVVVVVTGIVARVEIVAAMTSVAATKASVTNHIHFLNPACSIFRVRGIFLSQIVRTVTVGREDLSRNGTVFSETASAVFSNLGATVSSWISVRGRISQSVSLTSTSLHKDCS